MPEALGILQLPHLRLERIRRRRPLFPADQIPPQLVAQLGIGAQRRRQLPQNLGLLPLLRRLIQHLDLPVQAQLGSEAPHQTEKKTVQRTHLQAVQILHHLPQRLAKLLPLRGLRPGRLGRVMLCQLLQAGLFGRTSSSFKKLLRLTRLLRALRQLLQQLS